jgi:fumarate reductase subunit D
LACRAGPSRLGTRAHGFSAADLTLGLAIGDEARFENFLRWSDRPLVKLSEGALLFLLAIHVLGGLRLLVIENLPWVGGQKWFAAIAAAVAILTAITFLVRML